MNVDKITQNILKKCLNGDNKSLLKITKEIDNISLKSFVFNIPNKIEIDKNLAKAINLAKKNIYKFHEFEYKKLDSFKNDKIETSSGVFCWKKFTPIENVGLYIPHKLFSSVLMNVIPAKISGCKNIVVCTPPFPSNEILYTLKILGIKKVYTIGGAQAIFAMAYGIGEIPKVDKIFGPGNEFVDSAKKIVANHVAIDMPAGPSEVMVVADKMANKNSVIFDLLAQLEHGKSSKAWLFSDCDNLIKFVKDNIKKISLSSNRYNILQQSIKNLEIYKFKNLDEVTKLIDKIAPEHLILNISKYKKIINKINNAGSIFIGKNTPESIGDYLSGANHVLPTNGFAKSFSGLGILSFGKFITFQFATKKGLEKVAKEIEIMAEFEGLGFHKKSIKRT